MYKRFRSLGFYLLGVIVILLAFNVYVDIPVDRLKAKYTNPASQFLALDGMQVHYCDEGKGETIVLLHGTASSLHTWDVWTVELKKRYRVIRLDLPAFGLTGPNPEDRYSILDYDAFLDKFVKTLQVDSFHLIGNSLGGNIAWNYAAIHPQKIQKLILLDPSGYPMNKGVPWIFKVAKVPVLNQVFQYLTPKFVIQNNLEQVYVNDYKITPELIDRYHELSLREGNRAAFVARAKMPFVDYTSKLTAIQAPTLLLWGKEDSWIPASLGPKFELAIPNAKLVLLEGAGHVPMEEVPLKSVKLVLDFLEN